MASLYWREGGDGGNHKTFNINMINSNNILSNISSGSHSSLWDEVAAIISGLIGGGLYGLKIRIPHSFGERGCDEAYYILFEYFMKF